MLPGSTRTLLKHVIPRGLVSDVCSQLLLEASDTASGSKDHIDVLEQMRKEVCCPTLTVHAISE